MERKIYSVYEIVRDIRSLLEAKYFDVAVRGEISNLSESKAGHIYFSLKDEKAILKAVLFKGRAIGIKFKLENGQEIVAIGSISVYEKSGEYQLIVEDILPEGIGKLQLAFEQLKKKLEAAGLFASEHKIPIPEFPSKIGIITSPTGAAIRDILNIINRKFSNIHIIIFPAAVQGESSADEICEGIETFNRLKLVDVIILARGGGSIEDLWSFNEEKVAYSIYNSELPIISAIGHERDWTIADYVADKRAATPSAAAELVIASKEQIEKQVQDSKLRLINSIENKIKYYKEKLSHYSYERISKSLKGLLEQYIMQNDNLSHRLELSFQNYLQNKKKQFQMQSERLNLLNPLSILSRGYSITYKLPENVIIKDSNSADKGNKLKIKLYKGSFLCQIIEKE